MAELSPDQEPAPWVPETDLQKLKALGKLGEEACELGAIVFRCIIQGIEEREPVTGKPNRQALEDEIADVTANVAIVTNHFGLDTGRMTARADRKRSFIARWLGMLAGLAIAGCSDPSPRAAAAPTPPAAIQPARFLAQSRCPDGTLEVASDMGCPFAAPQQAGDAVVMRRHDWPGSNSGPDAYQASDSYALPDGRFVTTWSYPPFAAFRVDHGDGGEVYAANGDAVRATQTQDGGEPYLQDFCGPDGWLLFRTDAPTGRWADAVAQLSDVPAGAPCSPPGQAFTRWRLEEVAIPLLVGGQRVDRVLPTIVSEHYDGPSIEGAHHLERFFFAAGVGRVIWESWTTGEPAGADLALRCPGTAWSVAPAPGWRLSDCRTSTNLVRLPAPWRGADYGWPPL